MDQIKVYFELASQAVFGLVIFATIVVRLTPSEADNEMLDKFLKHFNKFLLWAPTFGVNPNTKKLKEWYDETHK